MTARDAVPALARYLRRRRKAVMGFFAPGVGVIGTAYLAGTLSWAVVGTAAVACVLTAFGVERIGNKG